MEEQLSEKEIARRAKISAFRKKYIEQKRKEGFARYIERKRQEKEEMAGNGISLRSERLSKKKRKVGRPKKRGPKKKRKSRAKKPIDKRTLLGAEKQYNFKLLSCHNGKQDRYIGVYRTEAEAHNELKTLLKESEAVVFPQKNTANKKIVDSDYVYLLLERNRDGNKKNYRLKNKIGVTVAQSSNSEKWVIIDKEYYNVEETFWVWGFNPKDRKTYTYILENIILEGAETKYDFKRILKYKNKVICKTDTGLYDIIFCKDESDAIRFYNKLYEYINENKIKNIYFLGSFDEISDRRRQLESDLMEQTGWNKKKIQKKTT